MKVSATALAIWAAFFGSPAVAVMKMRFASGSTLDSSAACTDPDVSPLTCLAARSSTSEVRSSCSIVDSSRVSASTLTDSYGPVVTCLTMLAVAL